MSTCSRPVPVARPAARCRLRSRSANAGASHRDAGVALVWIAASMLVFIGFVGLATDTAYFLLTAHQLQNAADASSLAAAQIVRTDVAGARQAAVDLALLNAAGGLAVQLDANAANNAGGDIVVGRYDRDARTFAAQLTAMNAVKVTARRTSDSLAGSLAIFFGPVFGVDSVDVERSAVAMVGGGTGAGLIALNTTSNCALDVGGTPTLTVNDGDIQVNSSSSRGACANGNPTIVAPTLNVHGDVRFVGGVTFEGELNTGAPQVPDPLAFLAPPTWDPSSDLGTVSVSGGATVELDPGYYSGGISANNGDVTLNPGIYILDGAGLNVQGSTTFHALGVMFYVIGSGNVYLSGNAELQVTPPDPTLYSYDGVDTYEGVAIFQARDNSNDSTVIGTNLLDLEGTLYFPAANLTVSGTGDGFGNQLIADTIRVQGTGEIEINYDGRFPSAGNRVYLVE